MREDTTSQVCYATNETISTRSIMWAHISIKWNKTLPVSEKVSAAAGDTVHIKENSNMHYCLASP